jgi:hypothetical protein
MKFEGKFVNFCHYLTKFFTQLMPFKNNGKEKSCKVIYLLKTLIKNNSKLNSF